MLSIRDKGRYGIFKANSSEGEIQIDISIYGFGEQMKVIKNKSVIAILDTSDYFDEDEWDFEDDERIIIDNVVVYKPFIRCLKRYK